MKKYWKDIYVGDKIASYSKPSITKMQIAFFSAAVNEFSPLQMDDDFAKSVGYNGVFSSNVFALNIVSECLEKFASNITVLSLSGTFHRLMWPGDEITAHALVVQKYKESEEFRIGLDVWCVNQSGNLIMKGISDLLMFESKVHEENSTEPKPLVSIHTKEHLVRKYQNPKQEASKTFMESA